MARRREVVAGARFCVRGKCREGVAHRPFLGLDCLQMKLKFGLVLPSLALVAGLSGCVNQDDDFVPAKRPGFRPPSSPLIQDDLPPVDPLGVPSSNFNQDGGPVGSGGVAGSAVVPAPAPAPLPDPAPTPQPAPQPAPAPAPTPAPAPAPAPAPKAAPPEYAKRVPGKPNWIKSPYDGKILDATGFPPGTEVRDPISGKIMLVP